MGLTGTPLAEARAYVATAVRLGRDPTEARRRLAAEKIKAYAEQVVATAPPLTAEQADAITAILRPGVDDADVGAS